MRDTAPANLDTRPGEGHTLRDRIPDRAGEVWICSCGQGWTTRERFRTHLLREAAIGMVPAASGTTPCCDRDRHDSPHLDGCPVVTFLTALQPDAPAHPGPTPPSAAPTDNVGPAAPDGGRPVQVPPPPGADPCGCAWHYPTPGVKAYQRMCLTHRIRWDYLGGLHDESHWDCCGDTERVQDGIRRHGHDAVADAARSLPDGHMRRNATALVRHAHRQMEDRDGHPNRR